MQINRHHRGDAPDAGVAAGERSAVACAVSCRHDPLRIGSGLVGALERFTHVGRHGAGHQQHIGVARRGDEAKSEALEIVEHVIERMDLELAAVAGTGVDLANREGSAEPPPGSLIHSGCKLGERGVVRRRRCFGQRPLYEALEQQFTHAGSPVG